MASAMTKPFSAGVLETIQYKPMWSGWQYRVPSPPFDDYEGYRGSEIINRLCNEILDRSITEPDLDAYYKRRATQRATQSIHRKSPRRFLFSDQELAALDNLSAVAAPNPVAPRDVRAGEVDAVSGVMSTEPEPIDCRKLRRFLLSDQERAALGYPIAVDEQPGTVVVAPNPVAPWDMRAGEGDAVSEYTGNFKLRCCRCKKHFEVRSNGVYAVEDPCRYHWGRLNYKGYSCCGAPAGFAGCTAAAVHVHDGKKDGIFEGFAETQPLPASTEKKNYGVLAMDCEMCYTARGLKVCRVTLVSSDDRVIYDKFIKPEDRIVDYNTRFSGLTEENMSGAVTLRSVQWDLLRIINSSTILVGHALENDLVGLNLCHSSVVDTAALFPHHRGLPYRKSLRDLVSTILGRKIQTGPKGHDSQEDARACLDLVRWKLKKL